MSNITIPKKLDPIVKAFFLESPKAAKKLMIQAAKAIYYDEKDSFGFVTKHHEITNEEIEDICTFMRGIKPIDMLEAIIAAQIVVSHMLGMRKLSKGSFEDQRIGLKMLQFSSESIGRLQKKRSGGMQNITINYNHNSIQPSIPIIPIDIKERVNAN